MRKQIRVDKDNLRKLQASFTNISNCEKQQLYGKIVEECLKKEDQRLVIWLHLKLLLTQDKEGINWIMQEVNQMIDEAEAALLSAYQ